MTEAGTMNVSATFPCTVCSEPAGTVTLVRAGRPTPIPPNIKGAPPGLENLFIQSHRVVVKEYGSFTLCEGAEEADRLADAYEEVLRRADAPALYELNRQAAFFWCRECRQAMCKRHWTVDPRTTYDNQYATCPARHLRKVWGDD